MFGIEFLVFPSQLKRRRSPQERQEELQSRVTIPRVPQMSVHSRENCFPCTASTFKPRIDSHHGGTWDSPVGKPRGKASWQSLGESRRSLDPGEGNRDTAAPARKESARACPHSRRGLTPLGRLQKYPEIHVGTGEETSGSGTDSTQGLRTGIDGRGSREAPEQLAWGLAFPEATRAGL